MERFDPAAPKVQVFNPDYEKHGWQSTHSVLEVLHPDMPFLVDSVRMELTRRGYSIHTLQNSVLQVRRDAEGGLLELLAKGEGTEDSSAESLIFRDRPLRQCRRHARTGAIAAGGARRCAPDRR